MNRFKIATLGIAAALAAWQSPVQAALTVPYTENFTTDDASWKTGGSTAPTYKTTDGHPGSTGGYISNTQTLNTSSQGQTIMRGQDTQGASGGNFTGDWLAGNVYELSFWVRQHSDTVSAPLPYGVRFARSGVAGNGSAVTYVSPNALLPDVWTKASIIISASNALITNEAASFADVFPDLGKIQIFVGGDDAHKSAAVTLDVDTVGIRTPEPASMALLGVGAIATLGRRRRVAR